MTDRQQMTLEALINANADWMANGIADALFDDLKDGLISAAGVAHDIVRLQEEPLSDDELARIQNKYLLEIFE